MPQILGPGSFQNNRTCISGHKLNCELQRKQALFRADSANSSCQLQATCALGVASRDMDWRSLISAVAWPWLLYISRCQDADRIMVLDESASELLKGFRQPHDERLFLALHGTAKVQHLQRCKLGVRPPGERRPTFPLGGQALPPRESDRVEGLRLCTGRYLRTTPLWSMGAATHGEAVCSVSALSKHETRL